MTNDRQQVRTNLMTCMEILRRLKLYWADAEGEDKRILAHSLFEEIVYDMDGRQIIDFKVKAWAEPFLIYRAELLEDSEGEKTKNRHDGDSSNDVLSHDPNGTRTRVSTLKGWCPRPLDDGAVSEWKFSSKAKERQPEKMAVLSENRWSQCLAETNREINKIQGRYRGNINIEDRCFPKSEINSRSNVKTLN